VRLTGRDRFHLARVLGVDLPTLEHWERGLGAPDGAAHALLLIALRFPEVIRAFSTD
jgi:DNA-binding transcriptional regulator YiaG